MPSIKRDKEWANAIRKAVHELRDEKDDSGKIKKVRALNMLAKTMVTKAINGDVQAMKEIGDRLDGKPAQAIEGSSDNPVQIIVSTGIVRD